jgi:hypothetical protein
MEEGSAHHDTSLYAGQHECRKIAYLRACPKWVSNRDSRSRVVQGKTRHRPRSACGRQVLTHQYKTHVHIHQ